MGNKGRISGADAMKDDDDSNSASCPSSCHNVQAATLSWPYLASSSVQVFRGAVL